MGIIRAFTSALPSVMDEQWREVFVADAMGPDVLLQRGVKRVGARSTNTRMDDQVITNGSIIMVNEGQAVIATANGKIVDVCTEPGAHEFHDPNQPDGFFKGVFSTALQRVAYGGGDIQPIVHRVYYVNMMECYGNHFQTSVPIPFAVGDESLGLDMDGGLSLGGTYSYRITDPVKFYKLIVGNITGQYTRKQLNLQITASMLSALQPATQIMTKKGMRPYQVIQNTQDLCEALKEATKEGWFGQHGIEISSIAIDSVRVHGAEEVREAQRIAMLKDPMMAQATLIGAVADSAKIAAANPATPSRNADMIAYLRGQAPKPTARDERSLGVVGKDGVKPAGSNDAVWVCSCGARNAGGNFCTECGKRKIGGVL
ncbi:MAG: SPFH domain-containing protein [Firmicutes bacterium]|nr:SPFH domain-containing protein [Bacillota bacterium]